MRNSNVSSARRHITLATALAGFLALGVPAPLLAQTVGPNGGPVVVSDGHPIEFVSNGAELVFFVNEEGGQPMDTKELSARAHVQADGKTQSVQLKAQSPNKLVGSLKAPLPKGAKIVLSAKMHGHNIQARFAP